MHGGGCDRAQYAGEGVAAERLLQNSRQFRVAIGDENRFSTRCLALHIQHRYIQYQIRYLQWMYITTSEILTTMRYIMQHKVSNKYILYRERLATKTLLLIVL